MTISKIDLDRLVQSRYGENAYCDYIRFGQRGWYLYNDNESTPVFIATNSKEAFKIFDAKPDETKKPDDTKFEVASEQEMLDILFEKLPNAFFREPEKIRPLQLNIHKKIYTVLNHEYSKKRISAALVLYTQTIEYCEKIALGGQRIDIFGNLCGEIPQLHIEDAKARIAGDAQMRLDKKKEKKQPKEPLPPPEIKQLIEGKLDLCLKINELPANSETTKNGWESFIIDTVFHRIKVTVRPKSWKKLQRANRDYAKWVANIKGKMGPRIKGSFELLEPAIQIFEIKPKGTE